MPRSENLEAFTALFPNRARVRLHSMYEMPLFKLVQTTKSIDESIKVENDKVRREADGNYSVREELGGEQSIDRPEGLCDNGQPGTRLQNLTE